jgi:dethiobiotin synthetase
MTVMLLSSVTRISDLDQQPFDIEKIPKDQWATGDYAVGEITGPSSRMIQIELASGRMVQGLRRDQVVGALGNRAATLEAAGCWRDIEDDTMHAMTSAGLLGRVTSLSTLIPPLTELRYEGHVMRNGTKVCMPDFRIKAEGLFAVPSVLLVGTSMSSGKTTTGRLVVHELERMGLKVVGAKLTGAGRYRDILSFRDAGANAIYDFVDAGLPSTVVPEEQFREYIRPLLHHINNLEPDFAVIEAGASPLEPYNGEAAMDEIGEANIRCKILCASDPYAVVGVEKAFGLIPDLVTGPATSTSAAIDLVKKMTGVEAINIMDPDNIPLLRNVLKEKLNL